MAPRITSSMTSLRMSRSERRKGRSRSARLTMPTTRPPARHCHHVQCHYVLRTQVFRSPLNDGEPPGGEEPLQEEVPTGGLCALGLQKVGLADDPHQTPGFVHHWDPTDPVVLHDAKD